MKKIVYISLLTMSLAGGMTSCDLEAPTKSSMDASALFTITELAETAVMGIHQSFGETNSYRGRFLPYYGMNTDLEWINGMDATKYPDGGKYDLAWYAASPTNSHEYC